MSKEERSQKIIILAGPNGAGKTTFARSFLPVEADVPRFINADLIAAGLAPFDPESAAIRAGKVMLAEISSCVQRRESFAIETTLSSKGYRRLIPKWRALGFNVGLYFLSLPSVELGIERVAERVRQGGHHIPEAVIRRRYTLGLENFNLFYKQIVDSWAIYDNSGTEPQLLEWGERS
ncbi:MAG: AAA family ATPase [Hyphomonadaceae bacterium]